MAFRFLIYRSDFGDTIVRESTSSSSTGGTEAELFTDFIIPEIQPLYLWRVTGGTDVVPNTDQNIEDWLNHVDPPSGDDAVTYNIFTGYTAQTQTDLDDKVSYTIFNAYTAQTETDLSGKIDIVTGATGNIGEFDVSGNLTDTGLSIADITGLTGNDRYVSGMTYVGSTLTLQRTQGLPDLVATIVSTGNTDGVVSGATLVGSTLTLSRTEGLPDVTVDLSPLVTDIEADIIAISASTVQNAADILTISGDVITNETNITTISGDVVQNTTDIQIVSGATVTNASDIAIIDGKVDDNAADIIYLSGQTDLKQDILSAGEGINVAALAADTIQVDLSAFTAIGGFDLTLTGTTAGVINDLRTVARGLEYGADYNANFTVRSLVDKGYVDAVAAGLDLKESVIVATTSGETDIDLTLGSFGGVIDGVTLSDGDRVLIKNQDSTKEENGIYIWSAGGATFSRAIDFVDPNVTSGAFTFVETGTTNGGSGWVLVTQDPITIGTTELTFTMFSSTGSVTAGNGIDITNGVVSVKGDDLNGDYLEWTGTQFNVTGLTTLVDFNSYTGVTDTRISNIEADIVTISGDVVQNTADIQIVSGATDQNASDIQIVSGATDQNASDITFISGVTDTKLDTSIFTGYTASTASNELFLVHTGGTEINTTIATGIAWDIEVTDDGAYNYTGGTQIRILEAGQYEITYNIPFNQNGGNTDKGIGGNLVLNGTDIIDLSAAAGWTSKNNAAGSVPLPSINVSFAANDKIELALFRTGASGSALTSPNGSILIKKKNTLQ